LAVLVFAVHFERRGVGTTGCDTTLAAIIVFWQPGPVSTLESKRFFSGEFGARKWGTIDEGADAQSGATALGSGAS
jgi:hypothetical protein